MPNDRLREYSARVNHFLKDFYARYDSEPQRTLYEAMDYSLSAGGKRLRPVLVYEFCRMAGGDLNQADPLAAALEMIHTYSLIHDDLPCMDNDDFRRGKPTNHKVYGEAMAVLAGDALLTDAFQVASNAELSGPEDVVLAIRTLSQCAGSPGMVGGQALDIMSEERILSEEEVLAIQSRKTGALIHAACTLGVIAAGGTAEQIQAAGQFADALGLAFQIRDDILDVVGTREEMGKTVGTDSKKNTFVRLYGLEACEKLVQKYTDFALSQLSVFEDTAFVADLAESMTRRRN